ncbi:cytochrome c [Oceanicella sp. SM1341]|uniref:c-type cytochrome n=1 Tax=Oceanicella sp. SM1341 TaxID=1548889 RepID=UPI000E5447E5|nr:cytochrome c [Oceanicella sp. SM1341]
MLRFLRYLLAVALVVAAGLAWVVLRTPGSPFDGETAAPADAELVARGEYVARLGDCVACHSTPESAPFAGGLEMATPLGAIYTTNITPDPEHGIGGYTLADFDRAVRLGVTPDGTHLYPAMPYPSYAKYSDEDIRALYAYFTTAVEPAATEDPPSEIEWPMNMRWPLAVWSLAFAPTEPYAPDGEQDAAWNRGAYLVEGPGHCGSCHTPRGLAMQEKGLDSSDDTYLSGALLDGWYAPSLRNDHNTGLGRWSEDEIVAYLRDGRNAHAVVVGTMAEAFNNSTQFMTDDDLYAIARYLKSLPGDEERDGTPWRYDASTVDRLSVTRRAGNAGAQTYMASCATCHGTDGMGRAPWIPPLAGAASSLAPEAASSVNVTLNGSMRVVAGGVPDSYRMPSYRHQLDDREIAELLSFIRNAWGNHGDAVTPEEVAELRARTDPASPNPIVLQMR